MLHWTNDANLVVVVVVVGVDVVADGVVDISVALFAFRLSIPLTNHYHVVQFAYSRFLSNP